MGKSLFKDTFREIKNSLGRFLSIFMIVALGVSFFAGIKSTAPDMKITADEYFDEYRLMDFHLLSTMGFSENDIDAIEKLKDIEGVAPSYSMDGIIEYEEDSKIVKLISLDMDKVEGDDTSYINRVNLVEGRYPENSKELLVEKSKMPEENLSIGSKVSVSTGKDEDILDYLKNDEFIIVGMVESPSYISFERGYTDIGNGSIDLFAMVPEEAFDMPVYTDVFLTVEEAREVLTYDEEYDEILDPIKSNLENLGDRREVLRYEEILDEANEELDEAKKELREGEEKQQEELKEAEEKLNDAKAKIEDGEKELEAEEKDFQKTIAEAENEIAKAEKELKDGRSEYYRNLESFNTKKANANEEIKKAETQLANGEKELKEQEKLLVESERKLKASEAELEKGQTQLAEAEAQLNELEESIEYITDEEEKATAIATLEGGRAEIQEKKVKLEAGKKELEAGREELSAGRSELEAGKNKIASSRKELEKQKQEIIKGEAKLKNAKAELDQGERKLAEEKSKLEDGKVEARTEFAMARSDLEDAREEYDEGYEEYIEAKEDSEKELEDAREEIAKAEREIADIENPQWYVLKRSETRDYIDFEMAADRIDAIAKVFPVFFFLISILVSLTTMTRMVDEQRGYIGTLKALGYSNLAIASKYLIYAAIASIGGSIVGLLVGFKVFPTVIFNAYRIMYIMPEVITGFNVGYALISTSIAVLTTTIAALLACYGELMETPALLLRPKAPKPGKRILLERIDFIWSRLKFTQKVTARNLFRYKRRFFMTVIGISGCTALLVAGFGLRDSIVDIPINQYDEIYQYEMIVDLKDGLKNHESSRVLDSLKENKDVEDYMVMKEQTIDIGTNSKEETINLIVPRDMEKLEEFIVLKNRKTEEKIELDKEGVVITEKIAKLLGVKVGDEIYIKDEDTSQKTNVKVTGITENYLNHYVYMPSNVYENSFDKEGEFQRILAKTRKTDVEFEDEISEELLKYDNISGVQFITGISESFNDTIGSLNYVIMVLILSAAALAFVVLYNLTNINISERIREIATIKVLGFYDKEVSSYVYRENTILTLIGTALGLFLGIFLHKFIIDTTEIESMMFGQQVKALSYVYSAILTIVFAGLVNFVMYFKLRKIDMVESLKSVD